MAHSIFGILSSRFLFPLLLISPCISYAATQENDKTKANATQIKNINSEVAVLDNKIKNSELEYLNVAYFSGPTEGVPPALSFYYEFSQGKFILRACIIPVGHETWSKHFQYYFDSEGKPIKYLEKVKGHPDNPETVAIIYGPKNEIIWKNTDEVRMRPNEVIDLFNRLNKSLEVFSHY